MYLKVKSLRKVATHFKISKSIISIWNSNKTKSKKAYRRKTTKETDKLILDSVLQNKFTTLSDLQKKLYKQTKVILCRETIRRFLQCNGFRNKRSKHRVKLHNEKELIKNFKERIKKETREIISLDETYIRYHMKPIKGWVKKDEECTYNTNKVYSTKVCNVMMVISKEKVCYEMYTPLKI